MPKNVADAVLALGQEMAKVTWLPGLALVGETAAVAPPGELPEAAVAVPAAVAEVAAEAEPAARATRAPADNAATAANAAGLTVQSARAAEKSLPRTANRLVRRMNVPPPKTVLHHCERPPGVSGRAQG